MQRKGVPFTGFVPTPGDDAYRRERRYDFNFDPTGNTLDGSVATSFTQSSLNPLSGTGFQCTPDWRDARTGEPLRRPGHTVHKPSTIIPKLSSKSARGGGCGALSAVCHFTGNVVGYNYATEPIRSSTKAPAIFASITTIPATIPSLAASATIRPQTIIPGGSPTWAAQNAFRHEPEHRPITAVTPSFPRQHVFSATTINQFTAGFNRIFNHILSYGDFAVAALPVGALRASPAPISAASATALPATPPVSNQATNDCISCGMTSFQMGSYFSMGDRGYAPYQGGTNVYSGWRHDRPGSRHATTSALALYIAPKR